MSLPAQAMRPPPPFAAPHMNPGLQQQQRAASKQQLSTVFNAMTQQGNALHKIDHYDMLNLHKMNAAYLQQLIQQRQPQAAITPQQHLPVVSSVYASRM